MTKEEATIYIKEWLKDEYLDCKDRAALTVAVEALGKNLCDLCKYNPPSSADGKPCAMCPAESGVIK